jgi:glutamine amidotransferase
MNAVIFDYGVGNLFSLATTVRAAGAQVSFETDPRLVTRGDALILPGVGAFSPAAACLYPARQQMRDALRDGFPCLAICLGMQLLFERSEEGPGAGLGVIAGDVERLAARSVPHMGWNTLDDVYDPLVLESSLGTAYFAHSFCCRPTDESVVAAWTAHQDVRFPSIVRSARTLAVQFHPEKSAHAGRKFIAAFLRDVVA